MRSKMLLFSLSSNLHPCTVDVTLNMWGVYFIGLLFSDGKEGECMIILLSRQLGQLFGFNENWPSGRWLGEPRHCMEKKYN